MDVSAALDAFTAVAFIAVAFAIAVTIHDTLKSRRKGRAATEEVVDDSEPKHPSLLQRIIKPREEEGTKERDDGNIRIVLEMPREIRIKVDPNDLIAYPVSYTHLTLPTN